VGYSRHARTALAVALASAVAFVFLVVIPEGDLLLSLPRSGRSFKLRAYPSADLSLDM
jgi:hypothetical protein